MPVGRAGKARASVVMEEMSTPPSFPEMLAPSMPSCVIEPLWGQSNALIPEHLHAHPLGCHSPRISDRIVLAKLIQILVLGAGETSITDIVCSASATQRRRDEWTDPGIFENLAQPAWMPTSGSSVSIPKTSRSTVNHEGSLWWRGSWQIPGEPGQTRHQALVADRGQWLPTRLHGRASEPSRLAVPAPDAWRGSAGSRPGSAPGHPTGSPRI